MKVLFFAPHSAIWVHAFPEALIAESLCQSGYEVVYVTCGEALQDQCVAMNAVGMDFRTPLSERISVCNRCNAYKKILKRRLGLDGYDLAEVLQAEDREQLQSVLATASSDNFLELEMYGVPVGRYALYELLLDRKKIDLELTKDEWLQYVAALRGAAVALLAGRRILDREAPDRIVVYNSLYSVNHVMCDLARRRGVLQYFLHAGGNLAHRLQTTLLGQDSTLAYVKQLVGKWPEFRDRPCPPSVMRRITDHFLVLFSGTSVFGYSSAGSGSEVDLRARYGVGRDQRLLVATMSSYDERVAAQTIGALPSETVLLFPKQVDWIEALVDFIKARDDLFLLIRVHPREFPNKRERVKSTHAALLEQVFRDLPANVAVNWPTDHVSLYDLANEADVFLNAWSSAGKEMSLLGLPVVIYSPELVFYPADLNYHATSEAEFFRQIEVALEDGWSFERSRRTYRWLAVEFSYGLIDISDSYPRYQQTHPTTRPGVIERIRRRLNPHLSQERDCSARAPTLRAKSQIDRVLKSGMMTALEAFDGDTVSTVTLADETSALRLELARIRQALYGDARRDALPLACEQTGERREPHRDHRMTRSNLACLARRTPRSGCQDG